MINKRKRTEKNKNEKKSSWDSIINNELVWLLSGRRILVGDINKPQHNKYKTNNNCIPYITAQWVGVVVYTITDVLPSAQKNYQLNTCDQFLFCITFHKFNTSHHKWDDNWYLCIHVLYDKWCLLPKKLFTKY